MVLYTLIENPKYLRRVMPQIDQKVLVEVIQNEMKKWSPNPTVCHQINEWSNTFPDKTDNTAIYVYQWTIGPNGVTTIFSAGTGDKMDPLLRVSRIRMML